MGVPPPPSILAPLAFCLLPVLPSPSLLLSLYFSWKSKPKGAGEGVKRKVKAQKEALLTHSLLILALHLRLVFHFGEMLSKPWSTMSSPLI